MQYPYAPALYIANTSSSSIYLSIRFYPNTSALSQIFPQTLTSTNWSFASRFSLPALCSKFVAFYTLWYDPYNAGLIKWFIPVSKPIQVLYAFFLIAVTLANKYPHSATRNLPGSTRISTSFPYYSLKIAYSSATRLYDSSKFNGVTPSL